MTIITCLFIYTVQPLSNEPDVGLWISITVAVGLVISVICGVIYFQKPSKSAGTVHLILPGNRSIMVCNLIIIIKIGLCLFKRPVM